jgi:hypothetical protein
VTGFANEAASAAAGLQRWDAGTHYRTAQWWQSAALAALTAGIFVAGPARDALP